MLEALAVSVLLHLNPPDVVIYTDAGVKLESSDRLAADAACPYLRAAGVPLPVPYVIQPLKSTGEGGGQVPDPSARVSGLLRSCPEDATAVASPKAK
jgi:hypothetical protein